MSHKVVESSAVSNARVWAHLRFAVVVPLLASPPPAERTIPPTRRLLEPISDVPPAEYEMMYYRQLEDSAMVA